MAATNIDSADRSNGYDAASSEFMAIRNGSSTGVATVSHWARSLSRGASVLDLGCGHGIPISKALIDEGCAVCGVDASPSMIAAFRARFPHAAAECSAIEDLQLFGRRFDGATAWGLMFLLAPDIQTTLIHKVASVLKPGGGFLFTAPYQICAWRDSLTGRKSVSLGSDAYRSVIQSEGLVLVGEAEDEAENHYYFALKPAGADDAVGAHHASDLSRSRARLHAGKP